MSPRWLRSHLRSASSSRSIAASTGAASGAVASGAGAGAVPGVAREQLATRKREAEAELPDARRLHTREIAGGRTARHVGGPGRFRAARKKKDGVELLDFYKKLLIDLGGKGTPNHDVDPFLDSVRIDLTSSRIHESEYDAPPADLEAYVQGLMRAETTKKSR